MAKHFSVPRLKKSSNSRLKKSTTTKSTKKGKGSQIINKRSVLALLYLEYQIFMQSLLKEVSTEARNTRSKIIRREHVKAVGKRMLKKFKV